MAYILDAVKEHLDPEFIADASEALREGENQTARALHAWSATILAGLLNHVDNPKAMGRIYKGLDSFPANLTAQPKSLLRTGNLAQNDPKEVSGHLLGQLFGQKIQALNGSIAHLSGAAPKVVSETLGIAGPMVLSALGQRLRAGELSVPGLANLLRAEQPRIASMLPAELAEILGSSVLEAPDSEQVEPAVGNAWGWAMLLLVGIAAALLVGIRQCAG